MSCHQYRKYLLAFADGQIDVKSNCDLLDHLKMCPHCSRVVDQHQSLKSLLLASSARLTTPTGLKERICKNIGYRDPSRSVSTSRPPLWKRPVLRTTALAACIALAFLGLWSRDVFHFAGSGPLGPHDATARANQFVQGVVIQHNKCVNKCDMQMHHVDSLAMTRPEAAAALTERFGKLFMVAAPDLTGFGFEFESANFCTPGRDVHGAAAHVMYVNPAYGTRLSLFSTPRGAASAEVLGNATREAPFSDGLRQCENQNVVAWNSGNTTHIICGPINEDDLIAMVRDIGSNVEPVRAVP